MRWIVVGLGNPGVRYAQHRHNVGFQVVDALARSLHTPPFRLRSQSEIVETRSGNTALILAKPQTFMNLSGEAVSSLADHFQVNPEYILVVHDELELPLGRLKFKQQGGEAGHRGLLSISQQLQTQSYPRLRVGIGRPQDTSIPIVDYVLQPPSPCEQNLWQASINRAVVMIRSCCENGLTQAMNQWNSPQYSVITPETDEHS